MPLFVEKIISSRKKNKKLGRNTVQTGDPLYTDQREKQKEKYDTKINFKILGKCINLIL